MSIRWLPCVVATLVILPFTMGQGCVPFAVTRSLADDEARLAALHAEIEALAADRTCANEGDCAVSAFGTKACGGPTAYVVYSRATVDEAALAEKLQEYTELEEFMIIRYGLGSDCSILNVPTAECESGTCVAVTAASECENTEFYHYCRDQLIPLTLDVSRIGLYTPGGLGAEATDALTRVEIQVSDMTSGTLPGWYYAAVPASKAEVCGVQQIVAALAAEPAFDFVTPVFLEDSGPLRMTQDIIVQFSSELPQSDAQNILDATQAGEITRQLLPSTYVVRSPSRNGFTVLDAANHLKEQYPEVTFAEVDAIFTGTGD